MTSDGRRSSAAFAAAPNAAAANDGKRRSMPWEAPNPGPDTGKAASESAASFAQIKMRVHRRILERLNLSNLDKLERDEVVSAIAKVVQELVSLEQLCRRAGAIPPR